MDQVDALFDAVKKTFDRLDLLFNNAGMGAHRHPMDELTTSRSGRPLSATSISPARFCAQRAMAMMKAQNAAGGSSITGQFRLVSPRPNSAPYTATKHVITGLTKSISLDGRAFDIVCSQIDIGNVVTPMTDQGMVEGACACRRTAMMVERAWM